MDRNLLTLGKTPEPEVPDKKHLVINLAFLEEYIHASTHDLVAPIPKKAAEISDEDTLYTPFSICSNNFFT